MFRLEKSNGFQKLRYLQSAQRSLEELRTLLKRTDYINKSIEINLGIKHPSHYDLEEELPSFSNSFKICTGFGMEMDNIKELRGCFVKAESIMEVEDRSIVIDLSKSENDRFVSGDTQLRLYVNSPILAAIENITKTFNLIMGAVIVIHEEQYSQVIHSACLKICVRKLI